MLELLLDLLYTPSWQALYLGILVGIGAGLVYYVAIDQRLQFALASASSHCLGLDNNKVGHAYTVHHWLACFIRRKESPNEDEGDHSILLVN